MARTATNIKYKNNNDLRITYDDLITENYGLKDKLNLYETHYKNQNQNGVIYLNNNYTDNNNSVSINNKTGFDQAVQKFKDNIENYNQNNYNAIIMMKDLEIAKWKEQEKKRREKEKQQFNALINKYDQTLSKGEKENQQLKMRLKELEGYFA